MLKPSSRFENDENSEKNKRLNNFDEGLPPSIDNFDLKPDRGNNIFNLRNLDPPKIDKNQYNLQISSFDV